MLFYPLYYNIISLTSLKIIQAFHSLLSFAENQVIFWDFKIQNSIRITKGSDNRGSTVYIYKIYNNRCSKWCPPLSWYSWHSCRSFSSSSLVHSPFFTLASKTLTHLYVMIMWLSHDPDTHLSLHWASVLEGTPNFILDQLPAPYVATACFSCYVWQL